jgi:glycosyltransferase involved in cell wall biosynthesis
MMRIAHVTSYRPESANGVLVVAAKLTAHLVRRGVDIEFWHFRRDLHAVTEREETSGVRVVELPFPVIVKGAPFTYLRRMPIVSRRWIAARERNLDGLHFHSVFQPESWYLTQSTSLPFCLSPHGGYAMFLKQSWRNRAKQIPWRLLERTVPERARFVHAVSSGDADTIRYLVPTASVAVVPNGVESPAEPPRPIVKHSPWLFIGRLHVEKKGLDLLVDGYALASRRVALPTLIIRGPDFRGGRKVLEKLVQRHGLDERIVIGGATAGREKEELLASCALFLHASRIEGLPVAPLEALAVGRPVAVTPGTNLADAVGEAEAGFVIAAPTPSAVAEALATAAHLSATDLSIMGNRGRQLVEREFSWDHAAAEIHGLYSRYFDGN